VISEGSCDTEDWSRANDALHHKNKLHFKIVMFHKFTVLTVFWSNKCMQPQ